MNVTDRFLHYISFDTTSDSSSGTHPSTAGQLDFAAMLAEEMKQMGLTDISCDEYGYVFGTIPSTIPDYKGTILGFIAHMDTVDAAPGDNIKPSIICNYDGNDIILNAEKNIVMHTSVFPGLKNLVGKDLIVTDGTTLLGADDKAGVAEILTAAEFLMAHPEISHGSVRVGFTPDEEIGEGADLFDVRRFGADFAYTMDGGECGELEYENFNAASAHLTFCGVSIHPGSAKNKMINSALLAMEYQGMMPEAHNPEHTEGREGFIHLDSIKGDVEKTVSEYIIRDHERNLFEEKKNYMTRAAEYMNSKYGNIFARFVAGLMQVKDCTSGFRAIRADFIKQIDLEHLNVKGYAFQMNILFECIKLGAKTYEIPIDFIDRVKGKSKLRIDDVIEFLINSFDLFIRRFK